MPPPGLQAQKKKKNLGKLESVLDFCIMKVIFLFWGIWNESTYEEKGGATEGFIPSCRKVAATNILINDIKTLIMNSLV